MNIKNLVQKEINLIKEEFNLRNYIERRLEKYTQDNNKDFTELKKYFLDNSDLIKPKTPQEEEEGYLKLMHDFLELKGY